MGVRGLLKFLRTHEESRRRNISLKQTGERLRQEGEVNVTLVCDFLAVVYWLLGTYHEVMVKNDLYSNYSYMYGGDFNDYTNRILDFVKALRYIGIEPVFFVDGPRGSTFKDLEFKLNTWRGREGGRFELVRYYSEFCNYNPDCSDPTLIKKFTVKCLLIQQIILALIKDNVKVTICDGEADSIIGDYASKHQNVCGILTTDTDMTMMRGCDIFHCKFFDRYDQLKLNTPKLNTEPTDIKCDRIQPSSLARSLDLPEAALPALSIMLGNDFTGSINEEAEIHEKLEFHYPYLQSAANWIRSNKCNSAEEFLAIPFISEICSEHPKYVEAVKHTYEFYKHSEVVPVDSTCTENPKLIKEEIKKGNVSLLLLSVVNCEVYWRICIEELDSKICMYDALLPLRLLQYSLIEAKSVVEYGQSAFIKLMHPELKFGFLTLTLNTIIQCSSSILKQLRVLSNQGKMYALLKMITQSRALTKESANINGMLQLTIDEASNDSICVAPNLVSFLTCTCLLTAIRYNILFGTSPMPLVLACILSSTHNPPKKISARPSARAVTIGAQFSCILQHVLELASIVGINLCLPADCFQSFMYVPLHTIDAKQHEKVQGKKKQKKVHMHGNDKELFDFYCMLSGIREVKLFHDYITDKSNSDNILEMTNLYTEAQEAVTRNIDDEKSKGQRAKPKHKKK